MTWQVCTTIKIVVRTTTNLPINDIFNNNLSMLNNWLKANKLSLNIKESKYIIFHIKKKNIQSLTLTIDNVNIERVAEFNFLGLSLDEHLTWTCYIRLFYIYQDTSYFWKVIYKITT